MNKDLKSFLDRLIERWAVLVTRFVSSRLKSLQAVYQADQQSQLEDLARQYEADGKPEIAARLRQQAAQLSSAEPAAEAVEILERLGKPESEMLPLAPGGLQSLPNFDSLPPAKRKGRRKRTSASPSSDLEARQ